MKRLLLAAIVAMAARGSAWAQTATGVEIDIEVAGDLGQACTGGRRRRQL
jgi:hypothetical protein